MSEVSRILSRLAAGEARASDELLPLVYNDLRKLAAAKLAQEKPGQTLQATALVHEAYVRLLGPDRCGLDWDNRGHFYAAAAEAMRRILVENARRKSREKHGGKLARADVDLDGFEVASTTDPLVVMAVHESLDRLAERSPRKAELVKLRYFLGCTIAEAAEILGISPATAEEDWTFARAWLRREWLRGQSSTDKNNS